MWVWNVFWSTLTSCNPLKIISFFWTQQNRRRFTTRNTPESPRWIITCWRKLYHHMGRHMRRRWIFTNGVVRQVNHIWHWTRHLQNSNKQAIKRYTPQERGIIVKRFLVAQSPVLTIWHDSTVPDSIICCYLKSRILCQKASDNRSSKDEFGTWLEQLSQGILRKVMENAIKLPTCVSILAVATWLKQFKSPNTDLLYQQLYV